MMKGKRGLALAMSLISISLTACSDDYTYPDYSWKDGEIVTIGNHTYKYNEIYQAFEGTKSSASSYFTVAKSILAQSVTTRTDGIMSIVDNKIENLHDTWKTNARTNGTSYKEEQEKTFDSEGVEDENELREKYIAQERVDENSDAFETVKNYDEKGSKNKGGEYYISKDATEKFVEEKAPYHVSHILIKVDASSDGEGYYNGQISSDDAKQIGSVTRMLSSGLSFGSVAQLASDDSSNTQYGELYTQNDSSSAMVAMLKDTSYVNEFKLGVYAYDTFLNNKTTSDTSGNAKNSTIRSSLRVPGTAEGSNSESTVAETIDDTLVGQGSAFGIPLSVCFEMNAVAEWDKNPTDGSSVTTEDKKSVSARQYPRNVLFNNYFNYRGVSFVYLDSMDEFNERFLQEVNEVVLAKNAKNNQTKATFGSIAEFLNDTTSYLDYKRDEYNTIKDMMDAVSDSAFVSYTGTLSGYVSKIDTTTGKNETTLEGTTATYKVLSDGSNPLIIARAGTSGDSGYQGIHFISINNDPFTSDANGGVENKYQYYRANVPSDTKAETKDSTGAAQDAYSSNYNTNPSFINFVNADANSTTTYNNRRTTLEAVIKNSISNSDIALWKYNLEAFETKYGKSFYDYLPSNVATLIKQYISLTEESTEDSANDTLDSSWETYVNEIVIQQNLSEDRMVPTYTIGSFEAGYYTSEMEEYAYVD
jgi:hypothetical protein